MSKPEDVEDALRRIRELPAPTIDRFIVHCEHELDQVRQMYSATPMIPTFYNRKGLIAFGIPVYQDASMPPGILRAMLGRKIVGEEDIGGCPQSSLYVLVRAFRHLGRAFVDDIRPLSSRFVGRRREDR